MRGISFPSILFLSIMMVLLAGCASVVSRDRLGPEERWRYDVRLTRRGTPREGEWGRLYYRNREIPGWFSTVVIDGRRFDYLLRREPADFLGYRRNELSAERTDGNARALPPASAQPDSGRITEDERDRGWYWAGLDERKDGTPGDWVWISRENLTAFVDPDELRDFADEYELGTILRERETERPRPGFNLGLGFATHF